MICNAIIVVLYLLQINFEDILCSTQHAHEGDRAVDIFFGSVGYSLLLARKYCHICDFCDITYLVPYL